MSLAFHLFLLSAQTRRLPCLFPLMLPFLTTKTQHHNHTTTKTIAQLHQHKNNNTTTSPQKHKNTTMKTQPHHHKSAKTPKTQPQFDYVLQHFSKAPQNKNSDDWATFGIRSTIQQKHHHTTTETSQVHPAIEMRRSCQLLPCSAHRFPEARGTAWLRKSSITLHLPHKTHASGPCACHKWCRHHDKSTTTHPQRDESIAHATKKHDPSQHSVNKMMRLPRKTGPCVTSPNGTELTQWSWTAADDSEHNTHRRQTQLNPQTPTHKRELFATHSGKRMKISEALLIFETRIWGGDMWGPCVCAKYSLIMA